MVNNGIKDWKENSVECKQAVKQEVVQQNGADSKDDVL